ncbi:MAG: thiopurine S-methyltransferase [Motiliproteus sp.]
MRADFWHRRWKKNEIGFHQDSVNPFLVEYWSDLGLQSGTQVLVPLCGKSKDMLWLREQGHCVLGIELSELAIKDFVEENGLDMTFSQQPVFKRWSLDDLILLAGDFFSFVPSNSHPVDAIYDRAALIALPESMRNNYAQHCKKMLTKGGQLLLITLEFDQPEKDGPPFAIPQTEVEALYNQDFEIELLSRTDVLEENQRFKDKGLTSLFEAVYRMRRR